MSLCARKVTFTLLPTGSHPLVRTPWAAYTCRNVAVGVNVMGLARKAHSFPFRTKHDQTLLKNCVLSPIMYCTAPHRSALLFYMLILFPSINLL